MRRLLLTASLILSAAAGVAFAQPPASITGNSTPQTRIATAPATPDAARLSPAANEAVQVVNTFMAALASGELEVARQLMTPDAVVISNGQVLGDRNAYIDGAAKADAAALRSTERELLNRSARASSDIGWVVSEKRLSAAVGGQAQKVLVLNETMLLARTTTGWKITHIHWSGRTS